MNWKRLSATALGATMATLALGYGSAWLQREACEQKIFQEVSQRRILGIDSHGRPMPLGRDDVYATISWPFMLEAG